MTINEGMVWMKTLRERHAELVTLRNENSAKTTRWVGHTDKEIVREPMYDPKKLDLMIGRLAREIRVLDLAIKTTNGVTQIMGYTENDSVLGELS